MSCPIDRYMVDCSRGIEVVNILEDESWTVEPTLRPEDELVLRKLRDLLQSTADDLKELSTELTAARELSSQPKVSTVPLDEEFNQKTRIEQMVNAKFHGHKVDIDHGSTVEKDIQKLNIERKKSTSTGIQVELEKNVTVQPRTKNNGKTVQPWQIRVQEQSIPKKLEKSKTQENSMNQHYAGCVKINTQSKQHKLPSNSIAYSEILHTYVERENKVQTPQKYLQLQQMPSINIRGELKQQDVLHLDILPTDDYFKKHMISKNNTAVIEVQHNVESPSAFAVKSIRNDKIIQTELFCEDLQDVTQKVQTSRKVSEMSAYESSDCNSPEVLNKISRAKNNARSAYIMSPKSKPSKVRNINNIKHKTKNSHCFSVDEWKKKLNSVYGQPSTSNQISFSTKSKKKTDIRNVPSKKSNISYTNGRNKTTKLNNAEYVPYSKLTLGGVKLSDIEREVPDVNRKADEPLSPILDKILNERKNALQEKECTTSKILTTSDENLLREVVEVEKSVNRVIENNFIRVPKDILKKSNTTSEENSYNRDKSSSYDDDFEDVVQTTEQSSSIEKREHSNRLDSSKLKILNKTSSDFDKEDVIEYEMEKKENSDIEDSLNHIKNKTFNLSFKNSVDVFEFIHSVDTQDMGIQSNTAQQLLLKETQTSPRQESTVTVTNINPIHNDLWSSAIDKGEIEKMFKLEKEFIRQLIIDEYSDLVEKDITKSSTSKQHQEMEQNKNVAIVQKNTQTSPAHVKSIMTSPKKTKTRTTSPISLTSHLQRHSSPIAEDVANHYRSTNKLSEEGLQNNNVDLDISINLSSPRFNLKLPRSSQEVLSNLQFSGCSQKKSLRKKNTSTSNTVNSSSSVDADKSDSELSSIGEINFKLHKNKFNNPLIKFSIDSSSSSTLSKSSSEIKSAVGHLKSEGEISMGHL